MDPILCLVAVLGTVTLSLGVGPGCDTRADVTFILDSSDTVGQSDFNKQTAFVKNIVNDLNVGPNNVQVSTVTFNDLVHNQFFLNQYSDKNSVLNALSTVHYLGGNTHTADAIRYVASTSFSGAHGARMDTPHIAVLITDGPSISSDITKVQAQVAKDNNVVFYTVGVGGGVDQAELNAIASEPLSRYAMTADNYDSLNSISKILSAKMCNELPPNPNNLPAPTSCLRQADVVFMVDSSSNVGNVNFLKMQNYLKDTIANLDVGANKIQVGVMQYSSYPSSEFPLSMYGSRGDVLQAVDKLTLMGGGSNTASAITYARDHMFSVSEGARSNVPRIAVLVTDGGTIDTAAAVHAANAARDANITVMVVGVGNGVNQQELTSIAGNANNFIKVNSFDDLDSTINQLYQGACQASSSVDFSQAGKCSDKISNCAEYGRQVCTSYTQWAEDNCKSFCGKCPYSFQQQLAPCRDQLNNCVSYGKDACTNNQQWARDNCKQYCGFCEGVGAVGFYGRCAYKGKSYITGEKWQDGCDYDCVCEDGNSGKYHCYNKCPVYYDLPSFCTLVKKPGECCLQAVCNFQKNIQTFESTGLGTTSDGIKVCVYKGKQYYERQSWKDGCQYSCTCTDASRGAYRCEDLCPTYQALPYYCHLVQSPGACCMTPVCEFNQQHGSFSGYGSVTGSGSGASYIPPSACKDTLSNCAQYGKDSCTNYAKWAATNCAKYCGVCSTSSVIPKPGPNDVCIYEGKAYKQGETWTRGCSINCKCEDASRGYYRCTNRCPSYNNIPAGCNERQPLGYCCTTVECQTGTFYSSSQNVNSVGNGGSLHIINPQGIYAVPTAYGGGPIQDGSGGTGFTPPKIQGCLYKGSIYGQNQAFDDGCQKSCVCMNATSGQYACRDKCPVYQNTGNANCVQITDPSDPCCTIPKCSPDPATGMAVVPVPVYQPSVSGLGQVAPPSVNSNFTPYNGTIILGHTGFTPAPPTVPANIDRSGFCLSKDGTKYQPGESWEEGCDYNCICDNGKTGHYTCVDKCYKYSYVPQPYCHLIQDPVNSCCQIIECINRPQDEQFTGIRTTPSPRHSVCTYEGKEYQQGQTWYSGCSERCACEDALNGIYRCTARCPAYLDTPKDCSLIPDPQDPACCQMPNCSFPNSKNTTTGQGGVYVPQPIPPAVYPGKVHNGLGPVEGVTGFCVYKGSQYSTGQTWKDGCDFNCECRDAEKGYYECTDMCQRYTNLPAQCRLVADFANPCCKKPQCNLLATPGTHTGVGGVTNPPTPSPNPLLPPVLPPKSQYCVYKGANYIQGQTWEDGCNYKCRCDDSSRGIYTCNERCSDFGKLKDSCTLTVDPEDQCCLVPVCLTPSPLPGQTVPTGPTPVPTAPHGGFTGNANVPTPSPIPGQPLPTPKYPLGFCIYKGQVYTQDQKWDDGCQYTCVCTNSSTGAYRCDNKCPRYVNIPADCRLVKNPSNPCCQITECYTQPSPTPGNPGGFTGVNPTGNPGSGTGINPTGIPGGFTGQGPYTGSPTPRPTPGVPYTGPPTAAPQTQNTPVPGVYPYTGPPTPRPTPRNTPAPTPGNPYNTEAPLPKNVCVYKGRSYTQGQQWYDGCEFSCVCEDGTTGVYRCSNRCPTFPQLGNTCTLQPDPKDPLCCKVPVCQTSHPNQQYVTQPPAVVTGGIVAPSPTVPVRPSPTPEVITTPPTRPPTQYVGQTFPTTQRIPTPSPPTQPTTPAPFVQENMCVYKGKQYTQGQRWQDGCEYDCVCEDGKTGFYRCTQKCPTISDLQPGCQLVRDYYNPCCMKPFCTPTDAPPITLIPPTGTTVTNKPPAYCVYNGAKYTQGQSWDDGCDLRCICESADIGFYRCTDRCPHFGVLPRGCLMETDPTDSCCRQPKCNPKEMIAPTMPPTVAPTMIPGQTIVPGPSPTPTVQVPTVPPKVYQGSGKVENLNACRYKGIDYKQGQTWQDGCDLNCECIDDHTGRYRCVQRCPAYNSAPLPNCYLVVDPKDQCCKVYQCTQPSTPKPTPSQTPYPINIGTGTKPPNSGTRPTQNPPYNPQNPTQNPPYNPQNPTQNPPYNPQNPTQNPPYNPQNPTQNPPYNPQNPTQNPPYNPQNPTQNPPYNPQNPTPIPTSQQTPRPTPSPTPKPDVCVYKGVQYAQGQQWYDGCQLKCVCESGMTGYYRCNQRCAVFPSIPSGCTLVPDSNDPQCCQIPKCFPGGPGGPTPNPSDGPVTITGVPGVVTGFGNVPTTPYNPLNPPQPTGPNVITTSPIPGGNPNPVNTPGPTPGTGINAPTPSPQPKNACVYKGQTYQTGQKWQDGCKYNCVCESGMTGKYVCTERCSSFPVLPRECKLQRDPKDYCCMQPVCNYAPTSTPGPTAQPPIGGGSPTPQNPVTPPPAFCVYNGVPYQQGQTWNNGCQQKCRCDDAMKNYYTCFDRCVSFPNLPVGCTKVSDPNDPCCLIPSCPQAQPTPQPTYPPGYTGRTDIPYVPQTPVPTYPPGYTGPTQGPYMPQTPVPQTYPPGYTGPTQGPYMPQTPVPQTYPPGYTGPTQGPYMPQTPVPQTYPPGYTGPTQGPYMPQTPVPQTYPPGYTGPTPSPTNPPNSFPVPALPQGVITGGRPTDTPNNPFNPYTNAPSYNPNNPTPQPKSVCEYKGVQYTQGQTWDDGCSYRCQCVDSQSGHYACTERCRRFPPLPSNCYMVQDQNDQCCKVPFCAQTPAPTPAPTPSQTPQPNPVTGPGGVTINPTQKPTPQPQPIITTPGPIPYTQPSPREVCIMNGKTYTQGQNWFNGCQQKCVCTDGKTGVYTCTARCPSYDTQNLPSSCTLIPDPTDPQCCKIPKCVGTNTQPPVIVGTNAPTPSPTPYIVITGPTPSGFTHSDHFTGTPPPQVCIYKGRQYTQGQKWQDGCQYTCQCVDSSIGQHKCIERCSGLTGIPLSCKLKYNPQDPCCPLPDCPQLIAPTMGPNGSPAPQQPIPPQPDYCVYDGVPYSQGQSWNIGCEKKCVCDDAKTGQINCNDRCPTYPPLSKGCSLLTDPNDECCQAPLCINPNPQNPYSVISGSKGSITGTSEPVNSNQAPGPLGQRNVCVYHGKSYNQGDKWDDGCLYKCECLDGSTGRYRCVERCARHPQVPSYCTMVQDPQDNCCQTPYCPLNKPTPGPTQNPNNPNPNPNYTPTPQTGTFTLAPRAVCVYNGQVYREGQQWYDGCDVKCRCENATSGFYRCQQRCAKYNNLPVGCTLTADPSDPQCCQVPQCPQPQSPPGVTPTPGIVYQPQPVFGSVTGIGKAPTPQPTPQPTMIGPGGVPVPVTLPPGVSPSPSPTPQPGCLYKGRLYAKNQQWDDGCQYHCICLDDMSGRYTCKERCNKYPNLPQYCTLVKDPLNPCCPAPYCDQTNPTPTVPSNYTIYRPTTQQPQYIRPGTNPPISGTKAPITGKTGYCVFNGVYYKQGETWNDGCKQVCSCDDAMQGLYSCKQRCPTFNNLPNNCHLVADQNDACCVVPDCNSFPTPYPTAPGFTGATSALPIIVPTPVQQAFTGHGNPPNINPLYGGTSGTQKSCVYKGQTYQQGQSWDDGCQFTCNCFDASRGMYRCQNKCPAYYNLPAQCRYVTDPANPCCRKATCDMNQTPPPTVITTQQIYTTQTPMPQTQQPIPANMCRYTDNSLHPQGSSWDDGCSLRCKCENSTYNGYRCEQRCTIFGGLPSICTLVNDPSDRCCKIPKCTTQSGINLKPTYGTTTGTGTPAINIIPIGTHNFTSGVTLQGPGIGQGGTQGRGGVCVYKTKIYQQGQTWDDGCDYVCTCDNAQKGEYSCISKCPQLPVTLPPYCSKLTIPGECCAKLTCDIAGMNQTYKPPTQYVPPPKPTDSFHNPIISTGPKQPIYTIGGSQSSFSGNRLPGQGFPINPQQFSSVSDQCIFKSKVDQMFHLYDEGEKWDDGCDYKCSCKDGKTGYYECTPTCPVYNNLPSGHCTIVHVDGKCCSEPRCIINGQSFNPLTESRPGYTVYGTVNGIVTGMSPAYNFSGSISTNTGTSSDCVYKGKVYKPGSVWDDGCDFSCRCESSKQGQFTCTPRCPTYTSLPSFCQLVAVENFCCKQVKCDQSHGTAGNPGSGNPVTSTTAKPTCSWCNDALDNCHDYGRSACVKPYVDWANRNCKSFCGFCDCQHTTPKPTEPTTQPADCHDKLDTCAAFGKTSCTGIFEPWARDNCKYYCGYCTNSVGVTDAPTQVGGCVDKQPALCQSNQATICTNQAYVPWATENCKGTCRDLCEGNGPATSKPQQCTYTDGKIYNAGENWLDGCEKNCSCSDNGLYKCNKLCPTYPNLPANWVLKDVPGRCCPIVEIQNQNQCHYKGKSYNEHETWEDGCELNCVCTDGANGLYTCREKCPAWQLPDVCHWEAPATGKCCRKPVCPPPYHFQDTYPDE